MAGYEYRSLYSELSMERQHWFGAITAMDEQVGRLRSYLKSNGLAENTILWFCSDNGPSYIHNYNSAGPLRGKKSELYEGGIRVPAMLEWPEKFPDPKSIDIPASTSDFYPTLLAVTHTEMKNQLPLDGENILPVLEGKADSRSPIGFISPLPAMRKQETREEEQYALVDQQYKLLSMDNGESYQLYDLMLDEGETTDLAGEKPAIFNKMKNSLLAFIRSCKEDRNRH